MNTTLASFTDVLVDEICSSQPLSLSSSIESRPSTVNNPCNEFARVGERPPKGTGQRGQFRSTEEIDSKYRDVFSYPYFNLVQSRVIEDAVYSDKSIVVCAPTGSGKTVVFEMAIVQLLMELEDKQYTDDFKIIYMAPVKALCTERLTEWYPKFTKLGLLCIEVTGDTDVDFTQLKPYKIIITTPEKWDMLTRRWRDHRGLVEVIKLFLIDEVHILNDEARGPVLEAVVSRMKTIESSAQSVHRIEQLQKEIQGQTVSNKSAPRIRFVAVSATVSNPEDVANWLGTSDKPAVFYKYGDECRPVKLKRIVEGYSCAEGTSIFKFDIILNYKLWPVIQKYHSGKPTLIFCNTRKSVALTADTLARELTITFNAEQKAKLTALASCIKNKKLQALVMSGVGCHHAGMLYEERQNIESAFRNRDLPILITTTTLAMGVNLPAHLVIVKNTQQYVNGAYQEYSISTVLQMVGRAGRPQFDTEATAVIMTRLVDKPRYQALVGGLEPLQSFLHKRLAENLNSEAALGTVGDVAQCVQWLRSTFLYVRSARDPKRYLGLSQNSPKELISKKIEELCVKAMNGLASSGLITMDEACCIASTEAGRLMSLFYLDLETMKQIMKIEGTESLERLLVLICESHELADMHLRMDERRTLNLLNRNNATATIRFPIKGKISTRQMKLNCVIQAVLGCLSIPDPSLNQEAMKIMRIADRVCKCLVTYVTRSDLISQQPQFYSAVLNSILLAKCVAAHLWENSTFVSKQLKGIGPTFSTLLASAGKVNFMLLEESHPRDLERIMNKGPPAGNVLRKQVSLLPKYQLTIIPVDEKTVTVQLVLLNQAHLAENMENLTAGNIHKNYIIVGDSNNNLLLFVAFKDRDLISVFDGTITHQVRRKHNFEHKIFAHCVSSTFVGIDVQSEYLFNGLEPFLSGPAPCTPTQSNAIPTKKSVERQTCITDTFRERKRKINPDTIEKSKEKRKRENAIIENFKYLKQSFETASRNINQNTHQQSRQNGDILNKKTDACSNNTMSNAPKTVDTISTMDNTCYEEIDSDEFIDEEKIDSILNEIENEMGNSKTSINNAKTDTNPYFREKMKCNYQNPLSTKLIGLNNISNVNSTTKSSSYKALSAPRKLKPKTLKSNYTFIELLERKLSLSDDEEKAEVTQKDNGFSDTIKNQIQKYLTKTHTNTSIPNSSINMLLHKPKDELPTADKKALEITPTNQDSIILNSLMHSPYPRYEIKEILGGTNYTIQNSNKQTTKDEQNLMLNQDVKNKNCDFNEVDTRHCYIDNNMKTGTYSHDIILDDEHSIKYTVNEKKDLGDTLILNLDETCEMFTNQDNVTRKFNWNKTNENNVDDIICVEDYNFEKKNNEYCNNVAYLDPDVIMISPTEVTDQYSESNNMDTNDQCSVMHKQNIISENIVTEKTEINPSTVFDKNELQKLDESTHIDAAVNNPCTDIVLKNRYNTLLVTNSKASDNKALAKENISRDLYDTTKVVGNIVHKNKNQLFQINRTPHSETMGIEVIDRDLYNVSQVDARTKNPCSDIALKNRFQLFENDRGYHTKALAIENFRPNLYKPCSDIFLKNSNRQMKNNRSLLDKTLAIEDIGSGLYQYTKIDAPTNTFCSDIVPKTRKQLVDDKRVSHDKTLAIENIGYHHYEFPKVHPLPNNPGSNVALKSRNEIVKKDNASDNEILEMEDSGLNIHTNQIGSNKSICYSYVSNDTYPSYDVMNSQSKSSNYSSKNLEEDKQKADYVKRYTYSTSKIDVSTKQTPEYCVQFIKKVKMDLDITAIVSRKQNYTQKYKTDCEETSLNNKIMKTIELMKEDNHSQSTTEDTHKTIATVNNENRNTSKINLPSAKLSSPELPTVNNFIKQPSYAKSGEESKTNNLKIIHKSEGTKVLDTMINFNKKNSNTDAGKIKLPEIKPLELEQNNNNDDYGETSGKLEESETGNSPAKGEKNIRNILHKYSKILAKIPVKTVAPSCSSLNRTVSTSTTKSQKPFKISDINKLHATLPETIAVIKPEVEKEILQFQKVNRFVVAQKTRVDLNSSQHTECNEIRPIKENPDYEPITELYLEPIHLPVNDEIHMMEPSNDYKIDQSLFDPKTLLQSVADDDSDEIVPPPLQFCDGITYSPCCGNTESSMADDTVRLPKQHIFTEEDMEYDESIFDECSATNLTPSMEIETWNLSEEESWEPRNTMSFSPTQSFTVMRRNINDNFSQNNILLTQGKLGAFRFNQKSKFKIRK